MQRENFRTTPHHQSPAVRGRPWDCGSAGWGWCGRGGTLLKSGNTGIWHPGSVVSPSFILGASNLISRDSSWEGGRGVRDRENSTLAKTDDAKRKVLSYSPTGDGDPVEWSVVEH